MKLLKSVGLNSINAGLLIGVIIHLMNIILAGPCGVGKSTVGPIYAQIKNTLYFDFDTIKNEHRNEKCFWSSELCLKKCLPIILGNKVSDFILDIGGDTVFRNGVDNFQRLEEIYWLKEKYQLRIIVLIASEVELLRRYLESPKSISSQQGDPFGLWKKEAEFYWQKCADAVIDTTELNIGEIVNILCQINLI